MFSIPNIDPSIIGLGFDYALYGIAGVVAFAFIVGMIRGFWKETFRFGFILALCLISILFTKDIVDYLMTLDISQFYNQGISIGFGTTVINLEMGTPLDMTISFLQQLFAGFGLTLTLSAQEFILSFASVLLRYLVFILLIVVIFLLGEFVAAILYVFPFSLFIPKFLKKKVKLRLLGGLMGAGKVTVLVAMLLSPFTSLVNIINSAFQTFDEQYGEQITDETYQSIMGFLDAYDQSAFAQVLFSWGVSADGKTLDTQLMDYVTGEQVGDITLTLGNELTTIATISATLLGTGIAGGINSTVLSALATEEVFSNIILSLTGSALVLNILPIAVALALDTEQAQAFVDPSLLDLEAVDWAQELNNINDIAGSVFASGVLDDVIGVDPLSVGDVLTTMLSETGYPHIREALLAVDNSDFISQVLPAVLYKMVNDEVEAGLPEGTLGLSTFLPTAWESYDTIYFGSELVVITDALNRLVTDVEGLLPALLEYFTQAPAGKHPSSKVGPQAVLSTSDIVAMVRDNYDLIVNVLIGDTDVDGQPTNVDPTTGKSTTGTAILDSDLLLNGLSPLMDVALSMGLASLGEGAVDEQILGDTIAGLEGSTDAEKRVNFKAEFSAILGMLGAVIDNQTLVDLVLPAEGTPAPDIMELLKDEAFRNDIKEGIVPYFDKSQIFNAIIPGVLEVTLGDPAFDSFLSLIDLSVADFNFDFTEVSREVSILIDMVGYSLSVSEVADDLMNQFSTIKDDLIGLLDSLYRSDIVNPKDGDGTMLSENYYNLMNGIFAMVEALEIDGPTLDDAIRAVEADPLTGHDGWTTEYDDEGNLITAGENYHLINFLDTVLASGLFELDPANGDLITQMVELLPTNEDPSDPIGDIFNAVDSSVIISNTFGSLLDGFFGDTGGLVDPALGTTFENVTDWAEEGETLKFIIGSLADFTDGLEGLDFLNTDPALVSDILKGLARSQIFIKPDDRYVFPDFLLNKLKGTGGTTSIVAEYLYDPYEDETSPAPYEMVTADFYAVGDTRATASNWYEDDGELDQIVGFVQALRDFEPDDPITRLQSGVGVTADVIESILLSINDAASLRVLLYNLFETMLGTDQFNVGELSPGDANTYALLELTQLERVDEIGRIADLYGAINAMGVNAGGSFSMETLTEETINQVGLMLHAMHESMLFNTFDNSDPADLGVPREHDQGDLTVFEQTIKFILETSMLDTFIYEESDPTLRSGLLFDDITALVNHFAFTEGAADDWGGPTGEIDRITDIMIAFKSTAINFSDFGTNGATAMSDLMAEPEAIDDNGTPLDLSDDVTVPSGVERIQNLMLSINHSTLVSPAIGNLFEEIFDSGSFSLQGVDLTDANTGAFKDPAYTVEETDAEIVLMLDIYLSIQDLNLGNGTALTASGIDGDKIGSMLTQLHDSLVFNTFEPGKDYLASELTVFEQTIQMIIDVSQLDDYIYEGDLDPSSSLFEDVTRIENNFAKTISATPDGWTDETDGEILQLVGILNAFKATALDFSQFSGAGSSDVLSSLTDTPEGLAKVEDLLTAMNHSAIVYPAIPNLFGNLLTTGDVSGIGLDFDAANTGYRGIRKENLGDIGDQYNPYDDSEISNILDIFLNIKSLADADFTVLTSITNQTFDDMQSLVTQFFESNVFHIAGSASGIASDPTVFEQIMIKMMEDTGIATLAYDALNPTPNPNYFDNGNPLTGNELFATANEKAEFLVVNFEDLFVTLLSPRYQDGFTNETWYEEIDSFFRIFKEMKRILPSLGTAGAIDAGALTPSDISGILAVLNYSNLSFDAVPYLMKDAFDTISFDTYTEGQQNYFMTPEDYLISDLNAVDYSTTDFTSLNPPITTNLGVIQEMLDGFYVGGSYIDMGPGFDFATYIADGNSSEPIMHLFDVSTLFGNQVSGQNYRTRSLIFYNLMDTLDGAKFIERDNASRTKTTQVERLESIFYDDPLNANDPVFDYEYEAGKMDLYIGTLSDLADIGNAGNANGFGTQFAAMINNTFDALESDMVTPAELPYYYRNDAAIGDPADWTPYYVSARAYLVSELSAGFFTDTFSAEYDLIDLDPGAGVLHPTPIDFYGNDHENLNPREADGIKGSLQMIGVMTQIAGGDTSTNRLNEVSYYFSAMGSLVATGTTGGSYGVNPFDYTTWDGDGNSKLATVFYASRIVQDAAFTNLNAAMFTATFNPGPAVQLDDDPYLTNFVFEIEGQKIVYAFESI